MCRNRYLIGWFLWFDGLIDFRFIKQGDLVDIFSSCNLFRFFAVYFTSQKLNLFFKMSDALLMKMEGFGLIYDDRFQLLRIVGKACQIGFHG